MDSAGRAYVTGRTRSPNLVIHNAYQGLRRSTLDDAFLTKFNALGDLVTYSTFFGGSGNETAHGIAVDDSGLAYLAGETDSTDFVTTSDAFKKEHGGSDLDGFIVKLRTTASKSDSLVYSSFFGGSGNDSIRAVGGWDHGSGLHHRCYRLHRLSNARCRSGPVWRGCQRRFCGQAEFARNWLGLFYLSGRNRRQIREKRLPILSRAPARVGVSATETGITLCRGHYRIQQLSHRGTAAASSGR